MLAGMYESLDLQNLQWAKWIYKEAQLKSQ